MNHFSNTVMLILELLWCQFAIFFFHSLRLFFSHQHLLMVFHLNLRDGNSSQGSRTLLSILADINNAVVWMASTRPPIFQFFSLLYKPLGTAPRAPITIAVTVCMMFHSFVSSFAFLNFHSVVRCDGKVHSTASCLFSFFEFVQGLVVWPRFSDPLYPKIPENFLYLIL